jgi:hypothetical protein
MKFYWLTLGSLVAWRVTHLLNAEDGPRDIFVRLRRWVGDGFAGSLLDCFYCLSLWIAIPIALWLGESWKERLLLWPALSAAAIALERVSNRAPKGAAAAAEYFELPEETNDVLLREETTRTKNPGRIR